MQFVLSTCGTALLTNQANGEERRLIIQYANAKHKEDIPNSEADILTQLIQRAGDKLQSADPQTASKMSAELNGIIKLYGGTITAANDHHLLLYTDTWLGEEAASLAAGWLRKHGLSVETKRQKDLQTAELEAFQLALSDLVRWCEEVLPDYRNKHYRIVFNLTGGFKSVQGFLQTLAMFYADEVVYVFESGTELLRIPRLPVSIAVEDTVRQHLLVFRRLGLNLEVESTAGVPETILMKISGQVSLSPWGEIVWEQCKRQIYSQKLWPSPSPRVGFGRNFEGSLRGLPPDRLRLVNERIDDLARCLETQLRYNPQSLDFKKSTHELNAWSDQDAKRLYGHFAKEVFVLDKLDRPLH